MYREGDKIIVTAIIQARMRSTRLPGKVLYSVNDKPILGYVYERVRLCDDIENIVIATSELPEDDPVFEFCHKESILCYRGSESDVLKRYLDAALFVQDMRGKTPDPIFRITADCPLVDPAFLSKLLIFFRENHLDYAGLGESFPDGFNAEIFGLQVLKKIVLDARKPSEREHVTPFIKAHPELFHFKYLELEHTAKILGFPQLEKLNHLLLSLDESQDFEVISSILSHLYPLNPNFSMKDVLQYIIENKCLQPRIDKRGSAVGYLSSVSQEEEFQA